MSIKYFHCTLLHLTERVELNSASEKEVNMPLFLSPLDYPLYFSLMNAQCTLIIQTSEVAQSQRVYFLALHCIF